MFLPKLPGRRRNWSALLIVGLGWLVSIAGFALGQEPIRLGKPVESSEVLPPGLPKVIEPPTGMPVIIEPSRAPVPRRQYRSRTTPAAFRSR